LLNPNSSLVFQPRVMRFDVSVSNIVTATEIHPQAATNANGYQTFQSSPSRAISSDGSVALFSTFTSAPWTDQQVFRYVHGSGSTAVSPLPGGTWNAPVALSDDGKIVLAIGPSSVYPDPKKEVYLADYSTGSEHLIALGSPNEAWNFGSGGITADGSVVAITSTGCSNPAVCRYGYFHNSNGWFQLPTAMAAAGMNLSDWKQFQIQGISADGTMVWGSGYHNNAEEGYVAEFPAGFLKTFDVVAAAPADASIVGAWAGSDAGNPTVSDPDGVLVFMADGTYYQIEPTGFERGLYDFTGSSLAFTTRLDTNADTGLSDANGSVVGVSVVGDELRSPANCVYDSNNPDSCFIAHRITSPAGWPYGGWVLGDPTRNDSSAVVVLTSSGTFFMAQDGDPGVDPGGHDGIEIGTLQWDQATGVISNVQFTVDTNGEWGLSHPFGTILAKLSADELQLIAGDESGTQNFIRILDPATVTPAITSALTASGPATVPFSYMITATHGLTFGALGTPAWLSVDAATGMISGTPPSAGTFNVAITATNTFGSTDTQTLVLTIDPPNTSTGNGVNIDPEVPAGSATVGLTFTSVTGGGETTVNVIDPTTDPDAVPPPSGFTLGDSPIYYEIETTASFTGPVDVCFNYTGIDLGTGTPRLFHFVGGVWTDITTSVDPVNHIICGTTTSFSPFAIFVSPVVRSGFYSPITSTPGFVNVVKGGSTVPFKFNVYVDGVEKTDTAGLVFSASAVTCANPSSGTPIPFVTTSGTQLRYDTTGGHFVQNWKAPTAPGCYVVQMTTSADGLSLSALFKVK
jgi:hypothetical protein